MEWISVKDRWPVPMEEVIFTNVDITDLQGNKIMKVNTGFYMYDGVFKTWLSVDYFRATHWMPLPKAPGQRTLSDVVNQKN